MCTKEEKLKINLNFLKDIGFTKEDTIRVLTRAGGILAIQKTGLSGIFSTMKNVVGIDENDFADIVRHIPEMALLG